MNEPDVEALKDGIARLRAELDELEARLANWNSENTAAGRKQKAIAVRIVLSARHLQTAVGERCYSP